MSDRYREQSWSIAPGSWLPRVDDDCVTLEGAGRDTAVQISAYRKTDSNVTLADLEEFADQGGHREEAVAAQFGEFSGFGVRFADDGLEWRCWWLRAGPLLLFVTHTADTIAAMDRDRDVVDRMLGSLQYEPNAPAV